MTIRSNICRLFLLAALCLVTSCESEFKLLIDDEQGSVSTVSLSMKVASTGSSTVYEEGSMYENYIDLGGGDYRIYFFTNDHPSDGGSDTFIAQFVPSSISEVNGTNYKRYSMFGEVPSSLVDMTAFKVVVIANWGNYPDSGDLVSGTTTLKSLCSPGEGHSWGTFTNKSDFELSENNLIPFYGVTAYTGIEFEPNKTVSLPDPINLIRAEAKIEVVLEDPDMDFDSVVLHGYNERGFCAPEDVYDQDDYTTYSDDWYYVDDSFDLHLIGGKDNDNDSMSHSLEMLKGVNDEGLNVWHAYVPEYRNVSTVGGTENNYAYIQVNLPGFEPDLEDYRIYFKNYVDGTAEAGADYDIGRNVLYRFTVSLEGWWLQVHVDKWEDSFHNEFVFGDDTGDDTGD